MVSPPPACAYLYRKKFARDLASHEGQVCVCICVCTFQTDLFADIAKGYLKEAGGHRSHEAVG